MVICQIENKESKSVPRIVTGIQFILEFFKVHFFSQDNLTCFYLTYSSFLMNVDGNTICERGNNIDKVI